MSIARFLARSGLKVRVTGRKNVSGMWVYSATPYYDGKPLY